MNDIKISGIARKAAKRLFGAGYIQDCAADQVQLAINEACQPLVEALQRIATQCSINDEEILAVEKCKQATEALAAHRKEHGQ